MRIAITKILLLFSVALFGQLNCDSVDVYYVEYPANGVRFQGWTDGVPHDFPSNIWNGQNDEYGLPSYNIGTPPNAPDVDIIINDYTDGGPENHQYFYAVISTEGLGAIDIRDNNQNTGELIRPFVSGACCTNSVEFPESEVNTLDPRGYGYITTLQEESWYVVAFQLSDFSANGGIQLQYAPTGTTDFVDFPDAQTYPEKPEVKCKRELKCTYELQEGESYKPIKLCDPVFPAITLGGGEETDIELDVTECTGIFENCSNRSGNRFIRATSTVNLGWEYTDWARVGNSQVTSPSCQTDLQIVARLGDRYFQNDNSCIYTYFDVRLLINGAVVNTRIADTYDYECSFSNRLDIDLDDIATVTFHRDNVPAGATVEVEFRMRSLYTSMTNPTPSARIVWSGIRSEASFSFNPNDEITDVTALREKYWIKEDFSDLPFASTYSFGFGEAPSGAKEVGSETALNNQIKQAEETLDKNLERDISELEKID